jgi:hypothetical protein
MAKDKLDIDFKKITLSNGRTIEQQLKYEAQRLTDILQEEIYAWYQSYSPKEYERTYNMVNSLFADKKVSVSNNGKRLYINVNYNDLAYHESMWYPNQEVNILLLMNEGYQVSKGWHKNIENFGYREGGHFIERAIEIFKKEDILGVDIYINRKGG